jgi:ABC-2 type transport system ATP-binding protein
MAGSEGPSSPGSSATSKNAVVVSGVRRSFGTAEALRGVDFTAAFGEVTGMVGPNGAGKTTLLIILATLLAPDQGTVRISGLDPLTDTADVRRLLGWVPDVFGFYENLTAREYLAFSGEARSLPRKLAAERAAALLELVRMVELADRPVHVLSRGQKQRLAFASALVHEPTVLLLDEPTAGLDPSSRAEFMRLVRTLTEQGTAVIVSSHLLGDLEQMADHVVFIDRGVTVGDRRMNEPYTARTLRTWRIHSLDDSRLVATLGELGAGVTSSSSRGVDVLLGSDHAAATLIAGLVGAGVPVVSCGPVETSLEATYFELTVPE